jgi:LacI family transcriptional regulator
VKNTASPPHVALLIETTRTYTREILAGVRQYLAKYGPWSAFVELRSLESEPPEWLHNWHGDGILTRTFTEKMAKLVSETGLPAIELRSPSLCPNLPWVGMDNRRIGQMVAEHFINRGYINFAAYTLDVEPFFQERVRNFVTELQKKGYDCEELPSDGNGNRSDWEKSQNRLSEWLNALPKPVGVFAANDQLGVRILDACERMEIAVPEDVAVVGTENEETLCSFATPTLTSVQFDGRQVGYKAAGLLDTLISGGSIARETLVESPGIAARGSTNDLVINDGLIRSAVRIIREEALSGINVGDVCNRLNVSRSTLERRMKQNLHRTPKNELLRVRFKEVERLLRETDFTMETISELAGFTHCHYLQTAFKDRHGVTPGQFRQRAKS